MMIVYLSISNNSVLVFITEMAERLFSFRRKIVNGKSMKSYDAGGVKVNNRMIRSSRFNLFKALKLRRG